MDWLTTQAQQASPFIATFCLLALGVVGGIARMIWKQLLFERAEHRTAERDSADAHRASAKAMERLAVTVNLAVMQDRRRARRRATARRGLAQ